MSVRTTTAYLILLAVVSLSAATARGQTTGEERFKQKKLAQIRAELGSRGDKNTTWYVVQLQQITVEAAANGNGTVTRSRVRLRTVQGQDKAADMIYEFLTDGVAGRKLYYVDRFGNSEGERTRREKFRARLIEEGLRKGYQFDRESGVNRSKSG
jgi:hypothetical protein